MRIFRICVWLLWLSLLTACSAPLQRAAPTPTRMNQPNVEGDPVIATVFNTEIDRRVNGVIAAFLENIPVTDSG